MRIGRRGSIRASGLAASTSLAGPAACFAPVNRHVSRRTITSGPHRHWFGYYDKLQFGPNNRRLLTNRVGFEHRSPRPGDSVSIGYVDLGEGNSWVKVGVSKAWNWQQGSMLQWMPNQDSRVIWNDRVGNRFVSRLFDLKTGKVRSLPRPIATLSPDGSTAITIDFSRLADLRPGYGYAGRRDPNADVMIPATSGLWRMDLETGANHLVVSVADVASFGRESPIAPDAKHYLTMPLVNPKGSRMVFLHRWRGAGGRAGHWRTRMFTSRLDGSDLYLLIPHGYASHFNWRDPAHICCWTQLPGRDRGFYLLRDGTREATPVGKGVLTRDGHVSYLPIGNGREWILGDTYPDFFRRQFVYLYHIPSQRRIDIGRFWIPSAYAGEWRCDLHPRHSRDGRTVCVDAPTRHGRQLHLLDIGGVISAAPSVSRAG